MVGTIVKVYSVILIQSKRKATPSYNNPIIVFVVFFLVHNIQKFNGVKQVRFKLIPLRDSIRIVNFSPFTKIRNWDLTYIRGIDHWARTNSSNPCCIWNTVEFSMVGNYWRRWQWRCPQHAYVVYKSPSLYKILILESMVISHVLWLYCYHFESFPH